jgi:acyl carrier protein phosphodiesterase
MPNEETTEVTVEVTTPEPSPLNPPQEEPSPSLEIMVGELRAQMETMTTQVTGIQEQVNQLMERQQWTQNDLDQMMRSLWEEMSQMRSDVEELSESEIENTEQENDESNLEEIPVIPEQVPQEEPEEVMEVKTRRPWFL